ncbi:MAG TPA: MFS transporter [Phycisphaerae bacterium]|nr:MFS transporter [Phycisphaerae bacterium]HRR84151.1 MFS transporter [Phycisphaerae bacterium]
MIQTAQEPLSKAPPIAPTRTRFWVIVFAVTLAVVTYIDRVCISQAAPFIRQDLGLSEVQMGLAFAVFFWTYALFEIPGGWMGDRWGARRVLMRVVVWWSFFTVATGWAWNLASLVTARALFGAGEAGCFPNVTKAFATWLPRGERVRAQGLMWLSARWGGAFTPLLVILVLKFLSWRQAFGAFGLLGVIWAVFFYRWYRDDPRDNPHVNAAELALIPTASETAPVHQAVPWRKLLRSKTVWLLCAQYAFLSYGWTFYITWLPTYLKEARGLQLGTGAVLAGIPLLFGGVGSLCSGFIGGHFERKGGNARRIRRLMACAGCLGAAGCTAVSVSIHSPLTAMIVMGLASFFMDLAVPPSWAVCMDVGGRACGTLSGGMNMMGNLAGSLGPLATGFLLVRTGHNWDVVLYTFAGAYFMGTFCWMFLDPVTPLLPATPVRGSEVVAVRETGN